jgi:hypothetical protein
LTIQNSESALNPKIVNKVKRIDELHSEKESAYHEAVNAAISGIERNGTIKYSIQKAALALEEIYNLHGQEWMMQEIGVIIVRDLKTRGFPESKYKYVYDALSMYGDKFYRQVEHSSSHLVGSLTKHRELFYRTNAQRYYQALEVLKNLINDYDNLLKRDIQAIVPRILDEYDRNEKECKHRLILFEKSQQQGFDGGPEKYQDAIRIHKGIPKVPEKMHEELTIWISSFLPALIKKFTEYPIGDAKL